MLRTRVPSAHSRFRNAFPSFCAQLPRVWTGCAGQAILDNVFDLTLLEH